MAAAAAAGAGTSGLGGKKGGPSLGLGLDAFLAKEEEYKRLNAALEAQAAELVRQAEEAMRDQQDALSRPLSTQLELLEEEADTQRQKGLLSPGSSAPPRQPLNKKKSSSASAAGKERQPLSSAKPRPRHVPLAADDVAVPDFSLAKTIGRIEGQLEEGGGLPVMPEDLIPGGGSQLGAEAQIRFLKAKLRVMQEELDAMVQECGKKDGENRELSLQLKEAEEERGRLQRAAMAQQSQAEKHKALAEDAGRRSETLQQRLLGQEKELEGLKRAQKQASAGQSSLEVRLNRALEEAEKGKAELNRLKQAKKDLASQEQKKLEELKAENKRLAKQKEELMAAFKKQLKLIDILKRQKMHIEAAKMLSFTEEEFMKALEWGHP